MTDARRDVLVSGGTGALGRANVAAFLEAGDRVVVPWIVADEKDAMDRDFSEAVADGRLVLVRGDIAESDGAAAAVAAAPELEVLVNGAGGFAGGAPHWETDLAQWDDMYRINVRTAAALSHAALPVLRRRGRGCVVNVASQAAYARPATLGAYSASKAAVLVLTDTLQHELADTALRVNAVVPTTIDTPGNRAAMPDADFSTWTAPAAIAEVIRWLASPAAATVRGAAIPV